MNHRSPAALLDSRIPPAFAEQFAARGLSVLLLPPFRVLDEPVCCHPDMLAAVLGGRLLLPGRYYAEHAGLFAAFDPLVTDEPMGAGYPADILLNALCIGGSVYGRPEISVLLKESVRETGGFVPVRQGYARCSVLVLEAANAAVTADRGLSRALSAHGIEVLDISPGSIALPGYDCGFIGGASAVVGREVLFFGSLDTHPDSGKITRFVTAHGYTPVSLPGLPLTDFGGCVLAGEGTGSRNFDEKAPFPRQPE